MTSPLSSNDETIIRGIDEQLRSRFQTYQDTIESLKSVVLNERWRKDEAVKALEEAAAWITTYVDWRLSQGAAGQAGTPSALVSRIRSTLKAIKDPEMRKEAPK